MSESDAEDAATKWIGRVLGVLAGAAVFLGGWFDAVSSWGWLLGLAFGWIPAAIVGAMAGVLVWGLWPFLIIAGMGLYWCSLHHS